MLCLSELMTSTMEDNSAPEGMITGGLSERGREGAEVGGGQGGQTWLAGCS